MSWIADAKWRKGRDAPVIVPMVVCPLCHARVMEIRRYERPDIGITIIGIPRHLAHGEWCPQQERVEVARERTLP